MSTAITEYKVDMREIVCQFCPHPQYPDEGYYQIQTSGGDFLGNVGYGAIRIIGYNSKK